MMVVIEKANKNRQLIQCPKFPMSVKEMFRLQFVDLCKIEYWSVLVLRTPQKFSHKDTQMKGMKSERQIDDMPVLLSENYFYWRKYLKGESML